MIINHDPGEKRPNCGHNKLIRLTWSFTKTRIVKYVNIILFSTIENIALFVPEKHGSMHVMNVG